MEVDDDLVSPIPFANRLADGVKRLPFTLAFSGDYPNGATVAVTGYNAGGGPGTETTIPNEARLKIGVRLIPGQSFATALAQIRELAGDIELRMREQFADRRPDADRPRITVSATPAREPHKVDLENPFVRLLCQTVASDDVVGLHRDPIGPIAYAALGSGDKAYLGPDIPGVEFGPRGKNLHGPKESVSIESLAAYARTLLAFNRRVAEYTGR